LLTANAPGLAVPSLIFPLVPFALIVKSNPSLSPAVIPEIPTLPLFDVTLIFVNVSLLPLPIFPSVTLPPAVMLISPTFSVVVLAFAIFILLTVPLVELIVIDFIVAPFIVAPPAVPARLPLALRVTSPKS